MFIDTFLGPQGAGKDTQADLLNKQPFISAFSVGDILRNVAQKREDINQYLLQGTLVPPAELGEILVKYLVSFLKEHKVEHIILTGFPRAIHQIQVLDVLLKELNVNLGCVFYLYLDKEQAINRITNRYMCPRCGRIYNMVTNPPKHDTRCDYDGTKLIKRADDKDIKTILKRLDIFQKDTIPVINYFKKYNCVLEIDAEQKIEIIHRQLSKIFLNFQSCSQCSYG